MYLSFDEWNVWYQQHQAPHPWEKAPRILEVHYSLLDALVVAPCTGNTLAKLANGVTDSVVTMACKAHLRNGRPLVLALATNDGLSANAQNIGQLLVRRNIYLVPFGQDDPYKKQTSLVADFNQVEDTLLKALTGEQIQPILLKA